MLLEEYHVLFFFFNLRMIEFKNLRHVKLWKLVSFGLRVFILLRIGILKNFDCLVIIVILLG